MPEFAYRLICGQYVLHKDGQPVTAPVDEVALAFSRGEGILHKHGKPETVQQWVVQARQKLLGSNDNPESTPALRQAAGEMARALTVLQGRFLLEDLNQCLRFQGYAEQMYDRAMAGTLSSIDILGRVRQPSEV